MAQPRKALVTYQRARGPGPPTHVVVGRTNCLLSFDLHTPTPHSWAVAHEHACKYTQTLTHSVEGKQTRNLRGKS